MNINTTVIIKFLEGEMRYCAVATCDNEGVHLFPRNEALREKWIRATRIDKQRKIGWHLRKYSCICSKHFTQSDYVENTTGLRRYLKRTAVPSIFPWTSFKDLLSLPEPFEIAFNTANASKNYSKSELPIKFVPEYPIYTENPEAFTDPLQIEIKNESDSHLSSGQNISDNLPAFPDESGIAIEIISKIKEEPTDCNINSDQILKSDKTGGL